MAQTTTRRRPSGSRNGRKASQKTEKYRFAQNVDGEGTVAESEYRRYAQEAREDPGAEPDVLLDVPVVKVDSIHFELDDLEAHVALDARVLDLVKLNVGVDVHLGKVRLDIKGVEAQALLKVRLDHVAAIVDRVLTTLDRNPELLRSLGRAVEDIGSGAGQTLDSAGDAIEDVGEGAEGAVQDVGAGAGQAVGDIGEGAGQAVGQIGQGAGDAVEDVGQGAGQAAGELGQGAGQAVGDVGEGAGQLAGNLDQTVGAVGQVAGQATGGLGQAAGGLGQAAGGLAGSGGNGNGGGLELPAGGGAGQIAKQIARTVAKEIGSAASDEMKDVSVAAARKVHELGERRRERRAEKYNATDAALRLADELDVDIDEVEGSGAEGRITVKDVRDAQAD
jgi:pyruvate/2-oxoglutarate dehydrogenase complex dihydrolipoamide acyltransferase (E2) component